MNRPLHVLGKNCSFQLFGMVVALVAAFAWSTYGTASETLGPDWDEDTNGGGDAGDKPDTAQKVKLSSTATVTKITGELKGEEGSNLAGEEVGDYQDVYEVVIKNPGQFQISTIPPSGSTQFNSVLCVYDYQGTGLLANNDADQGTEGSRVGNQSSSGKFQITSPGAIYISISGNGSLPLNVERQPIFTFTDNPTEVVGPNPDSGQLPLDTWTGPGPTGQYVIALTAVGPFPPECGAENTQSCGQSHPLPFCSDPECCVAVCTVDPFCCEVTWDDSCVSKAMFLCNAGGGGCGTAKTGDCFEPHENPYCNDPTCCALVCAVVPFCCSNEWDEKCAGTAFELCAEPCNPHCPADLNFDGEVDGADLAIMLGSWNKGGCADIDGSGAVDGADLAVLLGQWGSCRP